MSLTPIKISALTDGAPAQAADIFAVARSSANRRLTASDLKTYVDSDFASKFSTQIASADTDDLSEGSSNLYFTEARARTALGSNGLEDLTAAEVNQLENIGSTTISATQWGYVGELDQALKTSDDVDFATLTTSGEVAVGGALTVTGNLTVNGTTSTVNSTTVTTADNIIVLNDGEVGAGVTAGSAGIEVDRGSSTNYQFVFDESSDSFKVGEAGSLQKVATREDSPTTDGFARWNNSSARFDTRSASQVRADLSLGDIALQDANSVNIDGGAIDGTPIGASSASTGRFTSITGTANTSISGYVEAYNGLFVYSAQSLLSVNDAVNSSVTYP